MAPDAYAEALARTAPALEQIAEWHASGAHAFLSYPDKSDDLPELARIARDMRQRFDRIALIGIGGASLGGQAVSALADQSDANATPLAFLDNPDSARLEAALAGAA
ncbi:MAG TPA: glucose-6-phosphate isomerase, partial [Alphaproteobacteria bacterium]|nr:glucose-6-phosphate isomerase [Alphaproteobacteria bacterium]